MPEGFGLGNYVRDICGATCATVGELGIYCQQPPAPPTSPLPPAAPPLPPFAPTTRVVSDRYELLAALLLSDAPVIELSAGVYNLTTQLEVTRDVTLRALKAGEVFLDSVGAADFLGGYVYKDRLIKISGPVNVVIDGLHIINGDTLSQYGEEPRKSQHPECAPQNSWSGYRGCTVADGGGILAVNGANVTITRSSIYYCSAKSGGGVAAQGANVTITGGTTIHDNVAALGGGVSARKFNADQSATMTITGASSVYDNFARSGGGAWAGTKGTLVIHGQTVIRNNSADVAGDGFGGGVMVGWPPTDGWPDDYTGDLTVTDASIYGNRAAYGGGLSVCLARQASLRRVSIYGNRAVRPELETGQGGGVLIASLFNAGDGMLITDQTKIYDNLAGSEGGGIQLYGAYVTIDGQSEVYGNRAFSAVEAGRQLNTKLGGGISVAGQGEIGSNLHITGQSIVRDNEAGDKGGGVHLALEGLTGSTAMSQMRVTGQSIISGNQAPVSFMP